MAALNRKSALNKTTLGLFKTLQDSLADGISTPPLLEENVPDDALVLTVWLEKIEDLSPELSLDHNGLADAEVIFELNIEHGGQGKQTKKSSTRLKTLHPTWYPKEKFQVSFTNSGNSDSKRENAWLRCFECAGTVDMRTFHGANLNLR